MCSSVLLLVTSALYTTLGVFYIYFHIYYICIILFIITKWFIFHWCYLFTESGKTLMIYITFRNCEVPFPRSRTKWSNFLYLFIYLILFPRSTKDCTYTFYSHEVKIITWFFWLLYISPMDFISTKWKKSLMVYLVSIETRKCVYFHKWKKWSNFF